MAKNQKEEQPEQQPEQQPPVGEPQQTKLMVDIDAVDMQIPEGGGGILSYMGEMYQAKDGVVRVPKGAMQWLLDNGYKVVS